MPIEFQRDIMHLINRKQNGVTLTIGPFANIDREIFKIVSELFVFYYYFNSILEVTKKRSSFVFR